MVSSEDSIEKTEQFTNKTALGPQKKDLKRLFPAP